MSRGIVIALLLLLPLSASAQAEQLTLNLWCELEPMISEEVYPLPREEARRRILQEAQYILSAMIYGIEFSYTPYDKTRGIAEELVFRPIALVSWGDPQLQVVEAEQRQARLFAKLRYSLADFQEARRKAWASNTIPTSMGDGEANLFLDSGVEGKKKALNEAVKNAIRNHLRPVEFNKPREIVGEFMIWETPQTIIASGAYRTRVQIKLKIREIRAYSIF
jgi:hypothetical protein